MAARCSKAYKIDLCEVTDCFTIPFSERNIIPAEIDCSTVHSIIAPGRDSYLVDTTENDSHADWANDSLHGFVKSPDRCRESLSVCIVAGVVRSSLCEGYGLRD